jgi:hypothetical protein
VEQSDAAANKQIPWWGWLLIGVVLCLLLNYLTSTHKGPVFERVSGATAYLAQVKTVGEGLGAQMRTDRRVSEAEQAKGKMLYLAMKMESDGLNAWLQTGLARRFNDKSDPAEYEARLRKTDEAVKAFVDWASKAIPPVVGAGGGGNPLADIANELIKGANETEDKMIQRLRGDLEKSRLRDWDKLGE